MGKLVGISVVVIALLLVVFAVGATMGGDDDRNGGGGAPRPAVSGDGAEASGARVVWTGPLVDDAELTGEQLDAVHKRVSECLPIERAAFLELCLQGREMDWYDEGGYGVAGSGEQE